MKITKIEAQIKTPGRYSIFVDNAFAFGLSEIGLLESGLKTGQELTKEEVEALKETAKTDKIYTRVLSLLARRPHSRWEIENYLRRKEIAPDAIEQIIAKLQAKRFIDDLDFARRWVENRRLLKPISTRKLELELRAKRINDTDIRQVLSEDHTDELSVLRAEVEKKRRQSRYQDDTKLMQYLARQGYSYDDIKRVLSGDAG